MEINLLKFLVKIIILSLLFTVSSKAEVRESRALVVASQEAVLYSELAARITSISVKEMERFKKGDFLIPCSTYFFALKIESFISKPLAKYIDNAVEKEHPVP